MAVNQESVSTGVAWQAPEVLRRLWDALALEYGELKERGASHRKKGGDTSPQDGCCALTPGYCARTS